MGLNLIKTDPLQQPGQLSAIDLNRGGVRIIQIDTWPPETLFFESTIEEPESIIVPVENLDLVSSSIAKDEEMAGERIEL